MLTNYGKKKQTRNGFEIAMAIFLLTTTTQTAAHITGMVASEAVAVVPMVAIIIINRNLFFSHRQ